VVFVDVEPAERVERLLVAFVAHPRVSPSPSNSREVVADALAALAAKPTADARDVGK
jgi:hypothetical protein